MKAAPATDPACPPRRRPAVVVEDPCLVVVESPRTADPAAVHDALEMLVKWAVRAHQGCKPTTQDSLTIAASAAENAGNLT